MLSAFALTACSDDKVVGDPAKDWDGSSERYISVDEEGFSTYYKPTIGRVGDPMPFYDKKAGNFKVLYLQEYDNNSTFRFHPYWGVSTTDGAHYQSLGEILPIGENDHQQDAALGTGCCYYNEDDGLYYIYYTGHNGNCENREVIMRATSPDFKTWTKDNLWTLSGPTYGYSGNDFRDPQIFVADDGLYRMLISTYPSYGGDPKFAEFKSSDMKTWEHVGQFNMVWDRMCECPDVFKMGDWWYLIYSEKHAAVRRVQYFKGKTLDELKACTAKDAGLWPDSHEGFLDSRGFYAGKTASDGTNRYIWGWCPTRSGKNNTAVGANPAEPEWAGNLVMHRLIQHSDGTLTLGEVQGISNKYNKVQNVKAESLSEGAVAQSDNSFQLTGNANVLFNRLGTCNRISFTVKTNGNTDKFGISLVRGSDSKKYYSLVVNPESDNTRKVNFEEEGTEGAGFIGGIDGYVFNRPADNTYHITIYTDNSVCVMYINDVACYTNRIYGIQKNCWSINNYDGAINVSNVEVHQY